MNWSGMEGGDGHFRARPAVRPADNRAKPADVAVPSAARRIGQAVRRQRQRRDWSIETLAVRAEVSYQYVSEIETGKSNFSIRVLEKLSRALEMSLVALIGSAYPAEPAATGPHEGLRRLPQAA